MVKSVQILLRYLLSNKPDVLVLSEFKGYVNGQKIIKVLEGQGFGCESSEDDDLGV